MIKYIAQIIFLKSTADIKKVHKILDSDIDLMQLSFKYEELIYIRLMVFLK